MQAIGREHTLRMALVATFGDGWKGSEESGDISSHMRKAKILLQDLSEVLENTYRATYWHKLPELCSHVLIGPRHFQILAKKKRAHLIFNLQS